MRIESTAEKLDFDGRVAAVTGGARGIGRGVSEAFAALGAGVAVVDVDEAAASETVADLRDEYDVESVAVECNVKEYEDAAAMVETVVDELGRLDALVNNAGGGLTEPFIETDPADWDHVIDLCYYGTLNCSHAALPHMIERGSGAIVNFASDSYKGNDPGLSIYGGAKAANVSVTSTIAKEVGEHGVRVNCVSPGTTWTPATEDWLDRYADSVVDSYALDRLGEPEDIADAVVFLASDAADWITGQVLSINGGYERD